MGKGAHEKDGVFRALNRDVRGGTLGRDRRETQGVVPPSGHHVHFDLRQVLPAPDLRGGDLNGLPGVVGAREPVEVEGTVRAEIRATSADRFDSVDVELPEGSGHAAHRVDVVCGVRELPSGDRLTAVIIGRSPGYARYLT